MAEEKPSISDDALLQMDNGQIAELFTAGDTVHVSDFYDAVRRRDRLINRKSFRPFSPEGDTETVRLIQEHTQNARTIGDGIWYPDFYHEMTGHVGVNKGDYQSDLDMYLRRRENLQPVDLVQTIKSFSEQLLANGEEEVNIIDFGAGRATTLCRAAAGMPELVRDGRVKFIATNMYSEPTEADLQQLAKGKMTQPGELVYSIRNNAVKFVKADILELHELMKGKPVHLMFLMHVFESFNVGEIADLVFKVTASSLHPKYGTLVVGHDYQTDFKTERGGNIALLETGYDYLEFSGFREMERQERFRVIQGLDAPKFPLTVS